MSYVKKIRVLNIVIPEILNVPTFFYALTCTWVLRIKYTTAYHNIQILGLILNASNFPYFHKNWTCYYEIIMFLIKAMCTNNK